MRATGEAMEQIMAQAEKNNSALHMAVQEGNNVSVDMILEALSKTHSNTSKSYKDLMCELID